MSENVNEDPDPAEPQAALAELDRVQQQVWAHRWWYVATAVVMAVATTAYYTSMLTAPDIVDAWFLPGALVILLVLAVLQWRTRSLPAPGQDGQTRAVWISVGLVFVVMVAVMLLPEDASPWIGLLGVLPGVPWAVLAWRVGRR